MLVVDLLLLIAKVQKRPIWPSISEWIKKPLHIYVMKYLLAIKKERTINRYHMDDSQNNNADWMKTNKTRIHAVWFHKYKSLKNPI